MTDEQIDAVWANTDSRGHSLYEPHQWEIEMRRRFARAIEAELRKQWFTHWSIHHPMTGEKLYAAPQETK